jgi:hypothetical protein
LTRCKLVGAHKLAIKTAQILSFKRHNFNHLPEIIRKENMLQEEVELNTGSGGKRWCHESERKGSRQNEE